jgi:hypothetical protein
VSKKYDIATAKTLLELAFPKLAFPIWDPPPYVIRDDGIYQSEEYRNASPREEAFDWSPAYDMDASDPMKVPMLPIPFGAPELAAFMLDGAGSMIPDALEYRIGEGTPDLNRFDHPLMRVVREALRESFALLQLTLQRVGQPNYEEIASAHHLLGQCEKENGMANDREGVFDRKTKQANGREDEISSEEIRARRERAVTSVSELNARAEQAHATAKQNWKDWRKRMVGALLEAEGFGNEMGTALDKSKNSPCITKDDKAASPLIRKRKALVDELRGIWPTIEKDLAEASRNGLNKAKIGGGDWCVNEAIGWAAKKGRKLPKQKAETFIRADEGSEIAAILKANFGI